jgi:hypothetical protein
VPTCRWYGKRRMFGRLNDQGVCLDCSAVVYARFSYLNNELDKALRRLESASTLKGRPDPLDQYLTTPEEAVATFEARGINYCKPQWSAHDDSGPMPEVFPPARTGGDS